MKSHKKHNLYHRREIHSHTNACESLLEATVSVGRLEDDKAVAVNIK